MLEANKQTKDIFCKREGTQNQNHLTTSKETKQQNLAVTKITLNLEKQLAYCAIFSCGCVQEQG